MKQAKQRQGSALKEKKTYILTLADRIEFIKVMPLSKAKKVARQDLKEDIRKQ